MLSEADVRLLLLSLVRVRDSSKGLANLGEQVVAGGWRLAAVRSSSVYSLHSILDT